MTMPEAADPERVFMVAGEDDHGDQHLLMTTDLGRAVARYREIAQTMRNVRGNDAFQEFARPIVDRDDALAN